MNAITQAEALKEIHYPRKADKLEKSFICFTLKIANKESFQNFAKVKQFHSREFCYVTDLQGLIKFYWPVEIVSSEKNERLQFKNIRIF